MKVILDRHVSSPHHPNRLWQIVNLVGSDIRRARQMLDLDFSLTRTTFQYDTFQGFRKLLTKNITAEAARHVFSNTSMVHPMLWENYPRLMSSSLRRCYYVADVLCDISHPDDPHARAVVFSIMRNIAACQTERRVDIKFCHNSVQKKRTHEPVVWARDAFEKKLWFCDVFNK